MFGDKCEYQLFIIILLLYREFLILVFEREKGNYYRAFDKG